MAVRSGASAADIQRGPYRQPGGARRSIATTGAVRVRKVDHQRFQDVDNALIDRVKFAQVREEQTKNVAALRRFRDLADLRYREGATIYLEVANAEQSLFVAQLAYVATQSQLFQSYANLYKAMGGGWVDDAEKTHCAYRSALLRDPTGASRGNPSRTRSRGNSFVEYWDEAEMRYLEDFRRDRNSRPDGYA
jgi:hypothetical protein